mmetsp:Transcript_13647/g.36648  ORF Transcript_13647/g.36648 Transcript_13647/m.36648 type:complete len:90 (-) Transcript_13647:419-688(-)
MTFEPGRSKLIKRYDAKPTCLRFQATSDTIKLWRYHAHESPSETHLCRQRRFFSASLSGSSRQLDRSRTLRFQLALAIASPHTSNTLVA